VSIHLAVRRFYEPPPLATSTMSLDHRNEVGEARDVGGPADTVEHRRDLWMTPDITTWSAKR